MKLGVLGGTFNPVHTGHLLIAETVREYFFLDKLLFVPANVPPHKQFSPDITDAERLKLIETAIESNPFFQLSDIELQRGGVSFTIDTVNYLYQQYSIEEKIYFIIGADLLKDLKTWHKYDELIQLINLVVVNRDKNNAKEYMSVFPFINTLELPAFSVSSSLIRKKLKQGKSIKYLVPEKVDDYIKAKKLYQSVVDDL